MTATATTTRTTVETATTTSAFLSGRTRRKPSGGGLGTARVAATVAVGDAWRFSRSKSGGDITSLMAAVAAIRDVDKLPLALGSNPQIF
jgi:hypothetical protein